MDAFDRVEVGIDIGGTFTDVVCRLADGELNVVKLPTTHANPRLAVSEAVNHLVRVWGVQPGEITHFSHGTTLATNAVIERKGAKLGLIATRGFRDVLEIGRQFRRATYDVCPKAEAPTFLVPRRLRKEVRERMSRDGEVLLALDETELLAAGRELADAGVEAVAIAFLFSFVNPAHELRARDILLREFPNMMLSLSCEVDPAFREYERTCVTAFDAYVKPVLSRYLEGMEADLRAADITAPLQIMLSRGGKCSATVARRRPVRLFLSGPAAGVIGAGAVGRTVDARDLITFDMGGTSCDIALIFAGKPQIASEGEISGYPVRVPMVDLNTIGSGGGSIASIESRGVLRVGPESAGSEPGPACYARGGEDATVTDACVVLGLLNPDYFAGGTLRLRPELSRRAIADKIAEPLGMSIEDAAIAIHRVVNAQMAEGIRFVSVYRGFDAREFALLALGGAGPLHACALARELGIVRVIVPPRPGVLSAWGLLCAPVEHEVSAALIKPIDGTSAGELGDALGKLDFDCRELMATEAVDPERVRVEHYADVCYVGQSYHLEVPLRDGREGDVLRLLYDDFRQMHDRVYGHSTDSPAMIVNVRSVHRAVPSTDSVGGRVDVGAGADGSVTRRIVLPSARDGVDALVRERSSLTPGDTLEGPAIIEQTDTTTLVEPGWRALADDHGSLILTSI